MPAPALHRPADHHRAGVLVTRGELIRTKPELVAAFVKSTQKGWQDYITDPTLGNKSILDANQHGMTSEALQFGSKALVELAKPGEMSLDQVGLMTMDRWKALVDQMVEIKLIESGKVKPEDCFTDRFIGVAGSSSSVDSISSSRAPTRYERRSDTDCGGTVPNTC